MACYKFNFFNKYIIKLSFNKERQSNFHKEYKLLKILYSRDAFYHKKIPFFFITKYIPGKTLNEFKLGFKGNLTKYIKELRRIHLGYTRNRRCYYWRAFLNSNLEKEIEYCRSNSLFNDPYEINELLKNKIKKIDDILETILHGDPSGDNVIFNGSGCYIIDIEHSITGDYIYDLAFLGTFYESFEHHIATIYDKFDKNFWFKFWTYYLRISIMKIVILHKRGIKDLTRAKNRIYRAILELKKLKYE